MNRALYLYIGPAYGMTLATRILREKHNGAAIVRHVRDSSGLRGLRPESVTGIVKFPGAEHRNTDYACIVDILRERFSEVPRVDPWSEYEAKMKPERG